MLVIGVLIGVIVYLRKKKAAKGATVLTTQASFPTFNPAQAQMQQMQMQQPMWQQPQQQMQWQQPQQMQQMQWQQQPQSPPPQQQQQQPISF